MNFIKFVFALVLGIVGIVGPMSAHAISLYSGTILTINTGMPVGFTDSEGFIQTDVSPGSWFAMDLNGNSKISGPEKDALSQGTSRITIGRSNTAPGEITEPFGYFGQTGDNRVYTAITSGFGGVKYAVHLEGCVIGTPETTCGTPPIPDASTYGMLLAGLGLVGVAATPREQSMIAE